MNDPLECLREVSPSDGVFVAISGGKDSVAALDICKRYFQRVEAFHLYTVPGLGFVERYLQYLERRYSIQIHRRPSPTMARYLRDGMYRAMQINVPLITWGEIEADERARTGCHWMATGNKKQDSLFRRGMLVSWGGVVAHKQRKIAPLCEWSDAQVYKYLRSRGIPLAPAYGVWNGNWDSDLSGECLSAIRHHWPEDYLKIKHLFPLCDTEADRWEMLHGTQKESKDGTGFVRVAKRRRKPAESGPDSLSEVPDDAASPAVAESCGLQPPHD